MYTFTDCFTIQYAFFTKRMRGNVICQPALLQVFYLTMMMLISTPVWSVDALFSGFGTLGISCFSADNTDYVRDELPDGPGGSGSCDAGLDSKLGIQSDFLFNSRLESTLQAIFQHNADDSYDPRLTLANLRLRVDNQLLLRFGRLKNPNFFYSEFRNVHYVQPWVRPPVELYFLGTTFIHDGLDLIYQRALEGWNLEIQAGIANAPFDVPRSNDGSVDEVDATPLYVNATLSDSHWQLKAGISHGSADFQPLATRNLFSQLRSAGFDDLASELEINNSDFDLLSLGLQYETNHWLFVSEYARRSVDGWFPDLEAYYFTLGKRMNDWLIYTTAGRLNRQRRNIDITIPLGVDPGLDALAEGVDQLLRNSGGYSELSIGFSHDLTLDLKLKLQIDWIKPDDDSIGPYQNTEPDYDYDDPDTDKLITFNLDFLF